LASPSSERPLRYIGTIATDGKQSRDEARKRDRFSMTAFVGALNRARLCSPKSERASRRMRG
jgi:hypothetical protein